MFIGAILLPAATAAAPTAISSGASSTVPPTFSATLASSIANSAPQTHDPSTVPPPANSKPKPTANFDSKSVVNTAAPGVPTGTPTGSTNLVPHLVLTIPTQKPSLEIILKSAPPSVRPLAKSIAEPPANSGAKSTINNPPAPLPPLLNSLVLTIATLALPQTADSLPISLPPSLPNSSTIVPDPVSTSSPATSKANAGEPAVSSSSPSAIARQVETPPPSNLQKAGPLSPTPLPSPPSVASPSTFPIDVNVPSPATYPAVSTPSLDPVVPVATTAAEELVPHSLTADFTAQPSTAPAQFSNPLPFVSPMEIIPAANLHIGPAPAPAVPKMANLPSYSSQEPIPVPGAMESSMSTTVSMPTASSTAAPEPVPNPRSTSSVISATSVEAEPTTPAPVSAEVAALTTDQSPALQTSAAQVYYTPETSFTLAPSSPDKSSPQTAPTTAANDTSTPTISSSPDFIVPILPASLPSSTVPLVFSVPKANPIAPSVSDVSRDPETGPPAVNPLPVSQENDAHGFAYAPVYTVPLSTTPVDPTRVGPTPVHTTPVDPAPAYPAFIDVAPIDSAQDTPVAAAPTAANGASRPSANLASDPDQVLAFNAAIVDRTSEAAPLSPAQSFKATTTNLAANSSPTASTVTRPIASKSSAPPTADLAPIAQTIARSPEIGTLPARNLVSNAANTPFDSNTSNSSTNQPTNNVSNGTPSLTSDLIGSNRAPNPSNSAPAATTNEEHAKSSVSSESLIAAAPQSTAIDKKPVATLETNVPSPPVGSSAIPSISAVAAQTVAPTLPTGTDPSPAITVPSPPAAPPPAPVDSDQTPPLPQTHQMLDSAPPATPASDLTALPGDVHTDAQTPAQMHVGLRTDAFGAVEIHTVVQQSQIGITVHSDRDISRWFSSEVPGLESGLNNSHLNLTAVNFDHGRSGVQAETSFQHGQSRQQYSQTPGSPSAPSSGSSFTKPETAELPAVDILSPDLSAGSAQIRVSILA